MLFAKRILSNLIIPLLLVASNMTINSFAVPSNSSNDDFLTDNAIHNTSYERFLKPNAGEYNAILHWVQTDISINKRGSGKVTMILNCTPNENHFGIYLRPIEEEHKIISNESYATQGEKNLEINFTKTQPFDVSYKVYIMNQSEIQAGKNLLYVIAYEAKFFFSGQIEHLSLDPSLVVIDLNRPYWDDPLEFRVVRIKLPVEVEGSAISNDFLNSIKFQEEEFMSNNYNLSFYGEEDSIGKHWLIFESQKQNLSGKAPFEVKFYLSINYFSLPKVINWLVILLVSLFTIASLVLFIVVINFKNKSLEEIEEFREALYSIAKRKENSED